MSVGLDAALATLREKNHPGIMQTSAEVLLTILGNVRARHPHTASPRTPSLTPPLANRPSPPAPALTHNPLRADRG